MRRHHDAPCIVQLPTFLEQEKVYLVFPCHPLITTIKQLLENANVDIHLQDNMGWTVLHLAMREKSVAALELLLSSPRMVQEGFQLCELMRTSMSLQRQGDPGRTGLWLDATPEVCILCMRMIGVVNTCGVHSGFCLLHSIHEKDSIDLHLRSDLCIMRTAFCVSFPFNEKVSICIHLR